METFPVLRHNHAVPNGPFSSITSNIIMWVVKYAIVVYNNYLWNLSPKTQSPTWLTLSSSYMYLVLASLELLLLALKTTHRRLWWKGSIISCMLITIILHTCFCVYSGSHWVLKMTLACWMYSELVGWAAILLLASSSVRPSRSITLFTTYM